MKRILLALLAACLVMGQGLAQPKLPLKLTIGYTATASFTNLFIGKEQGMFARHGLDVDLLLIALNSNIPPALLGGSVEIGGPTPSVLLQANEGGLDLVVIAGCALSDRNDAHFALMARSGSDLHSAQDLVGKKIGVPGLGAFHHVLVTQWLVDKGVDPKKVHFVEVPFNQMSDVLRAGSVDVVSTGDPGYSRILDAKTGYMLAHYLDDLPLRIPGIVYASTRDWARAHPDAVRGFQQAIAEADAFQVAQPAEAKQILAKYIKLPPDVLASLDLPQVEASITASQMQFWIDVMTKQGLLRDKVDAETLVIR